jgi:hypothetical protein
MTTVYIVELLNSNQDDYNFVSIHQDFSEALAKADRLGAVVSQWEVLNHRVRFVTMYNSKGKVIQCS